MSAAYRRPPATFPELLGIASPGSPRAHKRPAPGPLRRPTYWPGTAKGRTGIVGRLPAASRRSLRTASVRLRTHPYTSVCPPYASVRVRTHSGKPPEASGGFRKGPETEGPEGSETDFSGIAPDRFPGVPRASGGPWGALGGPWGGPGSPGGPGHPRAPGALSQMGPYLIYLMTTSVANMRGVGE